MSNNSSIPYGLISSLECLNRAALLEQSDDLPTFLSEHVEEMFDFSHDDSEDPRDMIYCFEEKWEKNHFREKKEKKTPRISEDIPMMHCTPAGPSQFPTKQTTSWNKNDKYAPYRENTIPTKKIIVSSSQASSIKAPVAKSKKKKTPQTFEVPQKAPYKPKGGYIYDPQEQPLRRFGKGPSIEKPFDNVGHWLGIDEKPRDRKADIMRANADNQRSQYMVNWSCPCYQLGYNMCVSTYRLNNKVESQNPRYLRSRVDPILVAECAVERRPGRCYCDQHSEMQCIV